MSKILPVDDPAYEEVSIEELVRVLHHLEFVSPDMAAQDIRVSKEDVLVLVALCKEAVWESTHLQVRWEDEYTQFPEGSEYGVDDPEGWV